MFASRTYINGLLGLVCASQHGALHAFDLLVEILKILETQLVENDVKVAHGVDVALDVRHLIVLEHAADVEDGVTRANVRQKRVAQALTFRRAFHQTGDVDDVEESRNFTAMYPDHR